jgi:hypothetical protein
MTDIIRTPRDGCFELRSNSFGSYLHPCVDPDANATLEADALKSFELNEDITPIPADLWSRWVKLCFHFTGKVAATTEVSCRLLRHEDDKSQWRILVPYQQVDGAALLGLDLAGRHADLASRPGAREQRGQGAEAALIGRRARFAVAARRPRGERRRRPRRVPVLSDRTREWHCPLD